MNQSGKVVRFANSPKHLTLSSISFITLMAVIYGAFEDKPFLDSLWWALITASTVGYGDTYPATAGGRFVASVLVLSTVLFLVPMITASIVSRLIVNKDVFTDAEQEEVKRLLREIRAHQLKEE